MIDFNLERALKGDLVVTRSGITVLSVQYVEGCQKGFLYPIEAYINGEWHKFTEDGKFFYQWPNKVNNALDLFMGK